MSEERKMEDSPIFKEVQDLLNDYSSGAAFISFKGLINVTQIKFIEPDYLKMYSSSEKLAEGDFFIAIYQSDKIRHTMRLSDLLDGLVRARERRKEYFREQTKGII